MIPAKYRELFAGAVERRLQQLAKSLGRIGEARFI
jgi:hypothetical protein